MGLFQSFKFSTIIPFLEGGRGKSINMSSVDEYVSLQFLR